jgi:t-SNARE complex subunit (syntaxin)
MVVHFYTQHSVSSRIILNIFSSTSLFFLPHHRHILQAMQQISVGFTQQQLQVVDDLEQVAEERDAEITRIAQSIEELSQIFKELAVLVIDQGTILDRIDFNMEQVKKRGGLTNNIEACLSVGVCAACRD